MQSGMPQIIDSHKKIVFISDLHLGAPNDLVSKQRELDFINWIDSIKHDISQLFLLGDIFDAWFEYKHVIPAKFTRFLGKCAELTDMGIQLFFMQGNHDLWTRSFMQKELGIQYISQPHICHINGLHIQLAHGDGMARQDWFYRLIKNVIYTNPITKFLYRQIHPDIGLPLARFFSATTRETEVNPVTFSDNIYHTLLEKHNAHIAYYIFGHVHVPTVKPLSDTSTYINLGSWFSTPHYLEIYEQHVKLKPISG